MRKLVYCVILLLSAPVIYAQKASVSTNLIGYAALGTMNVEASYAVSRRWSVVAGVRYNPFTFNKGDVRRQFQLRQQPAHPALRESSSPRHL